MHSGLSTARPSPREFQTAIVGPFEASFTDAASFETAKLNIFEQKIYHFDTDIKEPFIIDGGAHIGMCSLYYKYAHPDAEILAFEPCEVSADLFDRNMRRNDVRGVKLIRAGLAAQPGRSAYRSDGSDGGRIVEEANCTNAIAHVDHTVVTHPLSQFIDRPVDMLKLNIEGCEWPVLCELDSAGAFSRIRRMIIEYHGWPGQPQYLGPILQLLDRHNFRYLVHDFDRRTNPASKPPFRLRTNAPWFCLIYAESAPTEALSTSPAPFHISAIAPADPVSRKFGFDLGTPIDRYYIEAHLATNATDIRGRVLEVGDASYTLRFGERRVAQSDVLHATPGNPRATIIGDLASGEGIPRDAFDCIILTQTLGCIYDIRAAAANIHRALRGGGVVLATLPGISQISRYDMDRWGDYWRFTSLSARRLFADVFGMEQVNVEAHGNVRIAAAFLYGLPLEQVTPEDLIRDDPDYELLITVRAVRRDDRP